MLKNTHSRTNSKSRLLKTFLLETLDALGRIYHDDMILGRPNRLEGNQRVLQSEEIRARFASVRAAIEQAKGEVAIYEVLAKFARQERLM